MHSGAAVLSSSANVVKEPPKRFKAPLLGGLIKRIDPEVRLIALDLGPPAQPVIDCLNNGRCRIDIADLIANGGIEQLNAAETDDERRVVAENLLPWSSRKTGSSSSPADDPVDLILCWDLPNYLSMQNLQSLVAALSKRAAPGTRLHMLVVYAARDMPTQPSRYEPTPDGHLIVSPTTSQRIAAPRYSPESLNQAVGGFVYERGVLLANGMQEFVYTWPK
ncbi:MAG: hypothetical protein R3305_01720 [Gammaproteobacteria bacterium]|nr:hypothetical protein [Gammaproteobacteria bacterium]